MSNPTPRPASPVHPTQHQLDELEQLMQRMLALPVNQLDDEPAGVAALPSLPPLPEWESAPLVDMSEEREAEQPVDQEMEEVHAVSVAQRIVPVEAEGEANSQEEEVKELAEPVPTVERLLPVMRAPIVVRPAEIQPSETAVATNNFRRSRVVPAVRKGRMVRDRPGWGMRSLLWSNRSFDRLVGRWGATGRWLRGPYGRALLGLSGLLLLVAALVFAVLDWIGWTW